MNELAWRKSSYSGGQSANCVEVAALGTGVAVRDSKAPSEAILTLSAKQWHFLMKEHALTGVTPLRPQCQTGSGLSQSGACPVLAEPLRAGLLLRHQFAIAFYYSLVSARVGVHVHNLHSRSHSVVVSVFVSGA
jgi:hypothetical protein